MQKRVLKFILIFGVILFFIFNINVMATNDQELNNEVATGETQNENNNSDNVNNNVTNDAVAHNEDVGSTGSDYENETTFSPQEPESATSSTRQINSYSTISSLPEANLGLNNILNVILIAVGVIIILLAIAILIRLK